MNRHAGIEIDGVVGVFPWGIIHCRCLMFYRIKSVFLFKGFIEPLCVFLQVRDNFLYTFFICCFMIEIKLCPGKKWKPHSFWIFLRANCLETWKAVLPANCTAFFLLFIEEVKVGICSIIFI